MYKIYVRNEETGCEWWEYGFSRYMMKRLHYLMNAEYEVIWCLKLGFSIDVFKKCLIGKTQLVKNAKSA